MGFRRLMLVALIATGCEQKHKVFADAAPTPDACTDLSCFVVDCPAKGLQPTTITGTVFAPNGTLPLFGVNVYVPASDPGPLAPGVQCDRCALGLPGGAVASTQTDEAGNFRLENVPATADVPIVIQTGKWRRQFKISAVAACQDNPVAKADSTLPKNRSEGDMPQIAITTGNSDALECLVRKLGVADEEFGVTGDARAIHLYHGNGTDRYQPVYNTIGGTLFQPAKSMWDSPAQLATYDIVMLSCEGSQNTDNNPNNNTVTAQQPVAAGIATAGINDKPETSLQAVHDYAGIGGRVFMSHWHNVWIGGDMRPAGTPGLVGLPDWKSIGTFNFFAAQDQNAVTALVDQNVSKGTSFSQWLMNVGASTTLGQIPILTDARYTLTTNDPLKSDRRAFVDGTSPGNGKGYVSTQFLQFTTPNDLPEDQRCGKVVFSDMHVASGSFSNVPFPGPGTGNQGCSTTDLTPQEKALAFIFFDISSCVGVLQ